MADEDRCSGFMPGERAALPHAPAGLLAGLTFAAKDLFDVAGHPTTYGNPDWARTHPPAIATATAVLALAEAGARFLGKTKTVELAFGLTGENVWYGTPLNPAAPDRFPRTSLASLLKNAIQAARLTPVAVPSASAKGLMTDWKPLALCRVPFIQNRTSHRVLSDTPLRSRESTSQRAAMMGFVRHSPSGLPLDFKIA